VPLLAVVVAEVSNVPPLVELVVLEYHFTVSVGDAPELQALVLKVKLNAEAVPELRQ